MESDFVSFGEWAMEQDRPGEPEQLAYRHHGVRMHFWAGCIPSRGKLQPIVHWHDNFELMLVRDGVLAMLVGGETVRLEKGDFLFVNSGHLHKLCQVGSESGRFVMTIVHPALLGCEVGLMQDGVEPLLRRKWLPYVKLKRGHTGAIPEVFRRMLECEGKPDSATPMEAVGIAFELWAAMTRAFRDEGALVNTPAKATRRIRDIDFEAVRTMVSYMQAHYGERLTLDKIAATGGVCRSRCCAIFKQFLNASPIEYLNSYRLRVADRLLCTTGDSIAEIAFACGFSHQSYFTEQYRAAFEMTPMQRRKAHRSLD